MADDERVLAELEAELHRATMAWAEREYAEQVAFWSQPYEYLKARGWYGG